MNYWHQKNYPIIYISNNIIHYIIYINYIYYIHLYLSHHFMANRWENNGNSEGLYFGGLQNHCRWGQQPWNSKTLAPWKKSYDQPRQHIKQQRHYFANKGLSNPSCGFSSSHVWIWESHHKESWASKNLLLNCDVGEDPRESLGPQGDQTSQS